LFGECSGRREWKSVGNIEGEWKLFWIGIMEPAYALERPAHLKYFI